MTTKIAFWTEKGGAGKTTLSYNFANYLAAQGHKTLMVDFDQQASLSFQIYGKLDVSDSVMALFKDATVTIHTVAENLDLIAGSFGLEDIEKDILAEEQPNLILKYWFEDYQDILALDIYDYIVFDTHPDFKRVNQNVIAASDVIISPVELSELGYFAKAKVQSRLDYFQKKMRRDAHANLIFVNNKLDQRTNESKRFLEKTKNDANTVATFSLWELFKRSVTDKTPIVEMLDKPGLSQYKSNIHQIMDGFESIKQAVDKLQLSNK